jgi:manganese/zinc/iron transport system substrate-binding protein
MLTDIVRVIAGERAEVVGLMGPGIDPHLHKPTRHDVRALASADVVFYVGLTLEGRMADALARLRASGHRVVAVGEAIPADRLRRPGEFEGHYDPHVWMDVRLWSLCAGRVAETLIEADPAGAETYRRNAAALQAELARLDEYVRDVVATVPEGQRFLVTAHDAFGYFSRAYGISVRSVQGITTESEAGLADITGLVTFLVEKHVPAIFIETSLSPRNLRAVLAGAAARGHDVTIGGELFSDATGPAGTYEGTYVGMIDHNATVIARALGGTAPARGMNGRLATVKE